MVMDDTRLLRQYLEQNSQSAFTQLTERYLRLVYGTCLRELGDPTLAEDATQIVFLVLARQAKGLRRPGALANWLFTTARLTARQMRKQEHMRRNREQEAFEQNTAQTSPDPAWPQIAEHINDAVAALSPADRAIVLLRFFDGLSLKEVGDTLGIPENTARMRVARSVDKMRRRLTRDGAAVSAVLLTTLLAAEAARATPAVSAAGITQGVFQTITPMGRISTPSTHLMQQTAQGVIRHMVISKLSTAAAIAALGILGMAGGIHALQSHITTHQTSTTASAADNAPSAMGTTMNTGQASLNGEQILERCQAAYHAVKTLNATVRSLTNGKYAATAHILFQAPSQLRVRGQSLVSGQSYALFSDGKSTSIQVAGQWQQTRSPELGIAKITGISGTAGAIIPDILLHSATEDLAAKVRTNPAAVAADTVEGWQTYRVSFSIPSKNLEGNIQETYWIKRDTFLLVKSSRQFKGLENVAVYDKPIINGPPLGLALIQ